MCEIFAEVKIFFFLFFFIKEKGVTLQRQSQQSLSWDNEFNPDKDNK